MLRVNWNVRVSLSEFRLYPEMKIAAARAIATWDPDWRDHPWDVTVDGSPQHGITFLFSYKQDGNWITGPVVKRYQEFDLEFRKWSGNWIPSCDFCGEHIEHDKQSGHLRWCIGWLAYKVDTRWSFPFGVWPATDNDRYRREKEVVEELLAFGFRNPGTVWRHLLKPADTILLRAGYWNDNTAWWWTKYWTKRERRRTIKAYSRLKHLAIKEWHDPYPPGYSYYNSRGSLVCQVKQLGDLWYCFTPRRVKLPHGFEKPNMAVAYYYPAPGTQLELVRRYVNESKWPFVRSKSYKALKLAA